MPHPEAMSREAYLEMLKHPKPPAADFYPTPASAFYGRSLLEQSADITLAEEVAKLREQVEELVYWMRPMTGNLITGKAAVEEFERMTGRKL